MTEDGGGPSTIRSTLALTRSALRSRARSYRNLVVEVLAITMLLLLWAWLRRSWLPLTGLVFLVPLVGLFHHRDSIAVAAWRARVLAAWSEGSLDFGALNGVFQELRVLPMGTIGGMLPPAWESWADAKTPVRRALSSTLRRIDDSQTDRLLFGVGAWILTSAAIVMGLALASWLPLMGTLAFGLTPIGSLVLARRRFSTWRPEVSSCLGEDAKARDEFAALAGRLDWSPVPRGLKERLLREIRESTPGPTGLPESRWIRQRG